MTASLRERAAAAVAAPTSPAGPPPYAEPAPERLEPIDAPEGQDDDPPPAPITVLVARVMRDIGVIGKSEKFSGGNAGTYNFRGVDRTVNAVAPVLRKHGVIVLPEVRSVEYRDITRAGGGRSHECVVTVAWHWIGPAGDELVAVTQGEALDTSDKATAKAQSVAWRTCLIQVLAIPTGDPDPDSINIERGEVPIPKATDVRDEILNHRTSLARLIQIKGEISAHGIGEKLVTNETGDDERLVDLLGRIGRERQAQQGSGR